MARGKKAAQAAGRREATAAATITDLTQQLERERAAKKALEVELRDEIRALRSSLEREVDARSAARIEEAERVADQRVADILARHRDAGETILDLLDGCMSDDAAQELDMTLFRKIMDVLGIKGGPSGRLAGEHRWWRRYLERHSGADLEATSVAAAKHRNGTGPIRTYSVARKQAG